MPLDIVTVPCLSDNYAYLLHDDVTGTTALVDAPEAAPIRAAADARGWRIDELWITHHHDDHVAGVEALRAIWHPRVVGAAADAHRLPALDYAVAPGDVFGALGTDVHVLAADGHTIGHVAFHLPGSQALFSGDSLMVMGCGRLFEGTAEQHWRTMLALRDLPGDTNVYSGHEYAETNHRFAAQVDPDNPDLISRASADRAALAQGRPTVPATLRSERATNPFLRADDPDLRRALDMTASTPAEVFAHLRDWRDRFS
ncbi:MAG: hydroxyacylglutathione hydrolase [Paracoccaceae bacterium]